MPGFNLPPGCSVRDIDDHFAEGPCAVCSKIVDDCVCPECPVCDQQGDPKCYEVGHLQMSAIQKIAILEGEVDLIQAEYNDGEECLYFLRNGKMPSWEADEADEERILASLAKTKKRLEAAKQRLEEARAQLPKA